HCAFLCDLRKCEDRHRGVNRRTVWSIGLSAKPRDGFGLLAQLLDQERTFKTQPATIVLGQSGELCFVFAIALLLNDGFLFSLKYNCVFEPGTLVENKLELSSLFIIRVGIDGKGVFSLFSHLVGFATDLLRRAREQVLK